MKRKLAIWFLLLSVFAYLSCKSTKTINNKNYSGIYKLEQSRDKLELNPDGSYVLWSDTIISRGRYAVCKFRSKGEWKIVNADFIELSSNNYYDTLQGVQYEVTRELKYAKDSLYFHIVYPDTTLPVQMYFIFDNERLDEIRSESTYIALSKKTYIPDGDSSINVYFGLRTQNMGYEYVRSRQSFDVFPNMILLETEKYNYYTIRLPNFTDCFFDFEPYTQEYIRRKNANVLLWRGEVWKKLIK